MAINKTSNKNLYETDQSIKDAGTLTINNADGGGIVLPNNNGFKAPKLGGNGYPNPEAEPANPYLDEIQRAASEKNYKTLLQSDIAAYNLKLNTQKYLNNELASQGLNTQGYGTSLHVGAENQAQNLYAQNLENYNEAEATALAEAQERQEANEAEAEAKATESDNQLITYLQYSDGSDESINAYMDKYGYKQNKDGVWVNKETGEPASAYIQAAIQSVKEGTAEATPSYGISNETALANANAFLEAYKTSTTGDGVSIGDLANLTVSSKDGKKTNELGNVVKYELQQLADKYKNYQDGTLIKLQRKGGNNEAYLLMYANGKFYLVSTEDDETEGGQVATRYNEYNGPKTTISGW